MKLKTIIGTALLAGTCALPASAQIGEQRHNFSVGINGGINLNSVSFSPRVRQNNLMGINGGVTARYISEKYFSMICGAQIELNFSQHGWDEFYEDYPELQYTRKMNYLEIPFLAHLAFGKDRGLQFFVHAGPQIGFFLGDSYTISGDWDNYPGLTVEQHDKAVDNRFDYGITGGAGVELRTKAGNFLDFIWGNITLGQKASLYWAIGAGRFLQTAGLFLLGLYIGRKELFVTSETHLRFWVKVLIIAAICFAPLYSLKEQIMASDNALIKQTVGTAFDMWQKFAFTFILVSSFVLLYQKECFRKAVSALRFYGKMSLTNYIAQSIMGAIIYFPFGLYLAPYCGYTISLLIGFALFLLQVSFCKWWLASHKQGPLESIWHKWTWMFSNNK